MIEAQEAYSKVVHDAIIIISGIVGIMTVGIFNEKLANKRVRMLVMHCSLVVVSSTIILLVIIPWFLVAAGYDPELHPWLVIGGIATGLLVWGLLYNWMLYMRQSVDDEVVREKQVRQDDVDQLGRMLDTKKAEIGSEVKGKLEAHLGDVKTELAENSEAVTKSVDDRLGNAEKKFDTGVQSVNSSVQLMETAADTCTASMTGIKNGMEANVIKYKEDMDAKISELGTKTNSLKASVDGMRGDVVKIQGVMSEIDAMKKWMQDTNIFIGALADACLARPGPHRGEVQHSTTLAVPDGQTPATTDQLIGKICKQLSGHGFRCVPGQNRSKPDIIIYDRDSKLVAFALVRAREFTDDPEDRTRRISRKMCPVGLRFAEEHGVPLVIIVVNTVTGRQWTSTVQPENLKDWKGVTTPEVLSQNDEVSGKTLERAYRDAIMQLGGMV